MAGGKMAALRAAANVMADAVRKVAGVRTDETASLTHYREAGDHYDVNAGVQGGKWGWEPIQAWMFQTGSAHPLFGNRARWYNQPHYPFLDIAIALKADDVANAYADVRIPQLVDEYLP